MPRLTTDQARIVAENTGLVGFVLNRHNVPAERWDDAYQDGLIGLMRAVQLFDPSMGCRLSTYSVAWIRQAVQRGKETFEGTGYRQAARGTIASYTPPDSLDADEDGLSFKGLLADRAPSPELRAVASRAVDEAMDRARRMCIDGMDEAIVEGFLEHGRTDRAWTDFDLALAARLGCCRETIRRRRLRIQSEMRETHLELAS